MEILSSEIITKYNNTVEITDAAKYKELIDNGYSIERLYDTKEIYEIIGPPFN